ASDNASNGPEQSLLRAVLRVWLHGAVSHCRGACLSATRGGNGKKRASLPAFSLFTCASVAASSLEDVVAISSGATLDIDIVSVDVDFLMANGVAHLLVMGAGGLVDVDLFDHACALLDLDFLTAKRNLDRAFLERMIGVRDRAINAPAGNLDFFLGHRDLEGLLLFDHVLVNVDFAALDRARAGGELFLDDVDGLTVVVRVDIPVHDRAGI